MASSNRKFKHILRWLFEGSRGGLNRVKIISAILEEPVNANQLAAILEVDYRTIRHHLDILEKNGLITPVGERYGKLYFLSFELEQNLEYLEEIMNKFGIKLKNEARDDGLNER